MHEVEICACPVCRSKRGERYKGETAKPTTTVKLEERLHHKIKRIAAKIQKTVTHIIEESVTEWVNKHHPEEAGK